MSCLRAVEADLVSVPFAFVDDVSKRLVHSWVRAAVIWCFPAHPLSSAVIQQLIEVPAISIIRLVSSNKSCSAS